MQTTLYLLCHGETIENANGIFQGQTPGHLSEKGKKQAAAMRSKVARLHFDAVLCMYKEQMEMFVENCRREDMCYFTASLPVIHIETMPVGDDLDEAFRSLFRAVCLAMDMDAARQQNRLLNENPLRYANYRSSRRDGRDDDVSERMLAEDQ